MTTLTEGDISIGLPSGARGRKFDVPLDHPLMAYGWSAVDFVIEQDSRVLLIEVKDPDDPDATEERRQTFLEGLRSGALHSSLARKYRDSFLYEWAANRVGDVAEDGRKPVDYYVLIAHERLDRAMLSRQTDALKARLPVGISWSDVWQREIVQDVQVHNIDSWNEHLEDFPVSRVTTPTD